MIKKMVAELVKEYGTNDPFLLADHLGIHIESEPLGNRGAYFTNIFGYPIIHINSNIPKHIAKYACAHELGHALLHQDLNISWLSIHSYHNKCKTEREANQFAVELLLPDTLITENTDISLAQLAKIVGVPEEMLSLKRLC